MKITIDVDVTPEELRQFLGLPNVEKLQAEVIANAQKYLSESGGAAYKDMISAVMQPMFAYQQWLQEMMTRSTKKGDADE